MSPSLRALASAPGRVRARTRYGRGSGRSLRDRTVRVGRAVLVADSCLPEKRIHARIWGSPGCERRVLPPDVSLRRFSLVSRRTA